MFGQMPDGREVHVLTIGGAPGVELSVLTLGATVHALVAPCGDGVRRNVVLGHASVADRLASGDYIGGTIGRYANRIAGGRFDLDGRAVTVRTHDRGNSCTGGPTGSTARSGRCSTTRPDRVALRHVSPAGDGVPRRAHRRGDLPGAGRPRRGDPRGHHRRGHGRQPDQPRLLQPRRRRGRLGGRPPAPAGRRRVHARRRHGHPGRRARAGRGDAVRLPRPARARSGGARRARAGARGPRHRPQPRRPRQGLRRAAVLESPATRTRLEVWSDQPGLQVYTGNFLDGSKQSSLGVAYRQGDGIALEPQLFPDSPNRPEWPSSRLDPGERYRSRIVWQLALPGRAPVTPSTWELVADRRRRQSERSHPRRESCGRALTRSDVSAHTHPQ